SFVAAKNVFVGVDEFCLSRSCEKLYSATRQRYVRCALALAVTQPSSRSQGVFSCSSHARGAFTSFCVTRNRARVTRLPAVLSITFPCCYDDLLRVGPAVFDFRELRLYKGHRRWRVRAMMPTASRSHQHPSPPSY
ncbi:unnamed protein product, partial [Ectocarpus sp. 12 AP-2014]